MIYTSFILCSRFATIAESLVCDRLSIPPKKQETLSGFTRRLREAPVPRVTIRRRRPVFPPQLLLSIHLGVSKNNGTPKSSNLIGLSIIFTIHFGGFPPIFGNIHLHLHLLRVSQGNMPQHLESEIVFVGFFFASWHRVRR